MDVLIEFFDWLWNVRTNSQIVAFVAGNIILLGLLWKGFIEFKKYKASLTPGTEDDAAAAKLEQVGNDMFRIVMPKEPPKDDNSL